MSSTRPASYDRAIAALIGACSLLLLAPLARPLVLGRVFVYNDLTWFHLPMRHLYRQALAAGDTVLWTPSIFAGFYLLGEGQNGTFHPWHQLLYRLAPLGPAFNLELIASYPAAFGGMACLLRRLRCGWAASLFGAMLFAFSGFLLLHHHHLNMVAIVAHLPWLLAAADLAIAGDTRAARRLAFAAMALLIASGFLLGFPQAMWWNALALGAFAAFRASETGRWRRLLPCAGAVAIGVLLGGIQLLPSADAAAHSERAGLARAFALTFSLHPQNLIQLWSPYFFARGAHSTRDYMFLHEFGIYSGAILPVAAIWVWLRRDALPDRRALIAAATAFAVVMVVLALGRYGGLAWLLAYVPVLGSLRAPARYIVLAQFALAILAAIAFDDLLAIAAGRRDPPRGAMAALWIPAALGIATLVALNGRLLPFGRLTFASAAAAAPGVAIAVAVTLLVFLAARRVRWAAAALVVVTAADLAAYGLGFVYREPARSIATLIQAVPPAPADPAEAYAAAPDQGPYRSDLLVLRGYRLSNGYVGLFPASRHPLDGAVALRLAGTRWTFTPDGRRHLVPDRVDRARFLDAEGQPATGTIRVAVDRPGHLVAHVEAPDRRVLAFTERRHHGWTATIDGAPAPIVDVEGDFLGCVVEAGVHRVELRFRPRSFVHGAIASATGALLLAGVLLRWPR